MSSGNNIEQTIREAIAYATEHGYTLIHSDWGSIFRECLCPMGCLLLKSSSDKMNHLGMSDSTYEIATLLGVSEDWVSSFIAGYDNAGFHNIQELVPEAKELGQKIFNDYNPQHFDAFLRERCR